MKTTICDICKNPTNRKKTKIKIKREYITTDGFRFFDKFDLCENCANEMIRYINNKIGE